MRHNTQNPMLDLAERYAEELSAQFRTLNFFVSHSGEIGRAHETYLRGVLERFLPNKCGIGSGFVAFSDGVSSQQDIIIYNQQDYPTLFQVGDCIVVDKDSVAALIEVKTQLNSKEVFLEAYKKASELNRLLRYSRFVGLFAWDGISLNSALEVIWEYIRVNPLERLHNIPNAIYIRGKYLLTVNLDGRRESPPFRLLEIRADVSTSNVSPQYVTEGQALLALMVEVWMGGLQNFVKWPWWLDDWWRELPGIEQHIQWPTDLQEIINDSLAK